MEASNTQINSFFKIFLFTDLVASAELKGRIGDIAAGRAITAHDSLFRRCLSEYRGEEENEMGDGFLALFDRPTDAVRCALTFQSRLSALDVPERLHVRIGIHAGEVQIYEDQSTRQRKLTGAALDMAGRLMSLAEADQILLTHSTFDSARQLLPATSEGPQLQWLSHGQFLFSGFDEAPQEIFEVGLEGISRLQAPTGSEKARLATSLEDEITLGWRPGAGQTVPRSGEWQLERKLGEGGFGEVWVGFNQLMQERRTFKFCFKADRLRSLKRELTFFRLMKSVLGERPDIVRLYGFRLEEAPFYLEMEYTEGGDLKDWVERRGGFEKISHEQCLEIVAQVGEALAAAHSVGVIHKDVKPRNILVDEKKDGTVQALLTDFGIGQLMTRNQLEEAGISAEGFSTRDSTMETDAGSRTGTRLYAAPELVAGKEPSAQSDIYAVGVILYQFAVADFTRPLGQGWQREIDDELLIEDIERCVDGNPDNRFSSAKSLTASLRGMEHRKQEKLEVRRAERSALLRRRAIAGVLLIGGLAILVAIALGYGLWREKIQRIATEVALSEVALQKDRAERQIYYQSIELAAQAIEEFKIEKARQLLNESPPRFRGWEWGRLQLLSNLDVATFSDHPGRLHSIAFSQDGTSFAVGGIMKTTFVYDFEGRSAPQELVVAGGYAFDYGMSVLFNPKGDSLVVGTTDNRQSLNETITFWDLNTGTVIGTLKDFREAIRALAYTPNGEGLFTAGEGEIDGSDPQVRLWEISSSRLMRTFDGHTGMVTSLALSPDGERLYSGSQDSTAILWKVSTGEQLRVFEGHPSAINTIAITPDEQFLATGSQDTTVKLWNIVDGDESSSLDHQEPVTAVTFNPSGSVLLTGTEDGTYTLWETREGRRLYSHIAHEGEIRAVAFHPSGDYFLTAGADDRVKLWSIDHPKKQFVLTGFTAGVTDVTFSPDGSRLGTVSGQAYEGPDLRARLWDSEDYVLTRTISGHMANVATIEFSPDGRWIATAGHDRVIKIWDQDTGEEVQTIYGHHWYITGAKFTNDGRFLISASLGTIKVWDTQTWQELIAFPGSVVNIDGIDVSPSGEWIASGGFDNKAFLWDTKTGRKLFTLRDHSGPVRTVTFSPDGRYVATASWDNTAILWNVRDGRKVRTFVGHADGLDAVAFGPEGRRLFTGSLDSTIKIWDVETGRELLTLKAPPGTEGGPIYSFDFSSDGLTLASAHHERFAVLWPAFPWNETSRTDGTLGARVDPGSDYKRDYWRSRASKHRALNADPRFLNAKAISTLTDAQNVALAAHATISDEILRRKVAVALRVSPSDLRLSHLARLEALDIRSAGVKSLEGLEHCTNLLMLKASGNEISDLGPLRNATSLVHLSIGRNGLSDLSPISSLSGLKWLEVPDNEIVDLSPLASLSSLVLLNAAGNSVENLAPLAGLRDLRFLYLDGNQLNDIRPLKDLINLVSLRLSENSIELIEPLSGMNKLLNLSLHHNKVRELSPLSNLPSLEALDLSHNLIERIQPISSFQKLFRLSLDGNPIQDLDGLVNLDRLIEVRLSDTGIEDLSNFSRLTSLEVIYLRNNKIRDIGSLTANLELGEDDTIYLEGNPLSDESIRTQVTELRNRGATILIEESTSNPD